MAAQAASSESNTRAGPVWHNMDGSTAAFFKMCIRDRYLAGEPNQIVVDYMASMTDSYFMAIYRHLFPKSRRKIQTRGYCADLI